MSADPRGVSSHYAGSGARRAVEPPKARVDVSQLVGPRAGWAARSAANTARRRTDCARV